MKESHKRSRNPAYKTKYRVTNWPQYEQSLRNRGSLTLWISPSAIKAWKSPKSGKPGRQQQYPTFSCFTGDFPPTGLPSGHAGTSLASLVSYSNLAIETILTLRLLFHLPLRQAEGFSASLFQLMKISLPIPDHTTLSQVRL